MRRKITLVFFALLSFAGISQAQEVWTLEQCVQYAEQNNLNVKQAQYNVQLAELNERGAKLSRLPSLNASFNGSANYGKSINPTTNAFESQSNFGGSGGLSAGIIVYDGNRINNQVAQGKVDAQAARLDVEATTNDISLQVASAYLNILLAEEQLANAQQRVQLSELQLQQADQQIQAGTLPENDRLDFVAQIARDQQTIIETENMVEVGYLDLKQLMQVDPNTQFVIERIEDIDVPEDAAPELYQTEEVYSTALQTQPQIEAAELRIQSAEIDAQLARAGFRPQLSLFGNLNTRYNNLTTNPSKGTPAVIPIENQVLVNGEPSTLTVFQNTVTDAPNMKFFEQMDNFFGQSWGFSLSIPIYNRHQNIIAVERAEVSALNQQVVSRQMQQQLKSDVQRSVTNAKASERGYAAAQFSLEAAEAAFQNAQTRYDLGDINSLEYSTARNTFDLADIELTRAKFQYIFDLKVVDFYLGRELSLD